MFHGDLVGFKRISWDLMESMINHNHLAVFEDWGSTAFKCQKCHWIFQWIFWSAKPPGSYGCFCTGARWPGAVFSAVLCHPKWWLRPGSSKASQGEAWARFGHLEISRDADSLRNLLFVSVWPSVWFSQMRIVIWLVVSKIFLISYVIYIYIYIFIYGIILSFILPIEYPLVI